MATHALRVAAEPFEWDGYCTRCNRGVSLDDGCETPTTAREAVCHECDKILLREEGAADERAKIVAFLRRLRDKESRRVPAPECGRGATLPSGVRVALDEAAIWIEGGRHDV